MPDQDTESMEGGRHKMTTAIKPIRPTHLEFDSQEDLQRFVNYTTSKQKTQSPGLNRMRELLKNHKPAPERK
jgi:hypothetical protein